MRIVYLVSALAFGGCKKDEGPRAVTPEERLAVKKILEAEPGTPAFCDRMKSLGVSSAEELGKAAGDMGSTNPKVLHEVYFEVCTEMGRL